MNAVNILLDQGLIQHRDVMQLKSDSPEGGHWRKLVEQGVLTESQALTALGKQVGMEFVDVASAELDLGLLKLVPQKLVHRHMLFPIYRRGDTVYVATSDPFDVYSIDAISAATGWIVEPVLAERVEIAKLIKTHLGVGSETIDSLVTQKKNEDIELLEELETDGSELSEMVQEASVVRLVNEVLLEAVEMRASDVHIESQAHGLEVRYRIDGILQTQPLPPEIHQFQSAIISRLKIMARLNIAEKRLPQDGRIKLKVKGREIDVRLSVIPMIHGEGLVMRILDKGSMVFELQKIGMDPEQYDVFKELIKLPHGIILVTGPTGSGKTTTLYSALVEINQPDVKIITTEDPVEYQLAGINQIQVHPKIGLTFAHSLRSILRHDPDVVLVGEIRDHETAENAIQASLTGHLVFSTLHTNDASGAFTRMTDMGVEPFLVASTVEAVMAQRLVRRLCPHCRKPVDAKSLDLPKDFPWALLEDRPLYTPQGCRECRNLGYRGRMGIYELLVTSERVRDLCTNRASSWEIKKAALAEGMKTLRDDAWKKAMRGDTSVEEVTRVTKSDKGIER
ncbi:MAG: type II/IV secretion system protein [Planctomycetaceae bacterium]|jgi:type II secretion system protein E|nr:type II/IV secretion system protein [Planctomycetaceae bacterium]